MNAFPLPTPLVDAATLMAQLRARPPGHPDAWRLLDCSFDLADPAAGRRIHAAGHLPGAVHFDLDDDLSDTRRPDARTGLDPRGRHPLPDPACLARRLGELGIGPDTGVVVYDRQGGMYAARAWWLLESLGHRAVALLDGGLPAWVAAGGALEVGEASPGVPPLAAYPIDGAQTRQRIDADALLRGLGRLRIVDARSPERFRGDVEPLDPVGGHIPGALNRPFGDNLQSDGRFKPPAQLRAEWAPLLQAAGVDPTQVVHQCGSGVTACHNLLAQRLAGFGDGVLYPGSWSQWCQDAAHPVARG